MESKVPADRRIALTPLLRGDIYDYSTPTKLPTRNDFLQFFYRRLSWVPQSQNKRVIATWFLLLKQIYLHHGPTWNETPLVTR